MTAGTLFILSGARGIGKTTTCQRLVSALRARGIDHAGLICPARVQRGEKIGIDLVAVRSGERRELATADDEPSLLCTAKYRFDAGAMAWGGRVLDDATPCSVLIIDELGPLELVHHQGWVNALDVLHAGRYQMAVVVIRPELVNKFRHLMQDRPCIVLGKADRDDLEPERWILAAVDVWRIRAEKAPGAV